MINAVRVAAEIIASLPGDKLPETTEKKQGYLHPYTIKGDVGSTEINVLVRDFEEKGLKKLEAVLSEVCADVEGKFPGVKIKVEIKEYYRNMKYVLDDHPLVMEIACSAIKELGLEPVSKPIRGGTDGSRLSYMGLPTPNIFAGGENFHSVKEYVSIQTMEKAVQVILNIARLWVETAAEDRV